MKVTHVFLVLPLMISCQRNPDMPTAEESRQLDDASNLLNQAPASLNGVDDSSLNSVAPVETENQL